MARLPKKARRRRRCLRSISSWPDVSTRKGSREERDRRQALDQEGRRPGSRRGEGEVEGDWPVISIGRREIKVDLLAPEHLVVVLPAPPKGVRVSGLTSEPTAGPGEHDFIVSFLVSIPTAIATSVAGTWLYEHIRNYRAKRI